MGQLPSDVCRCPFCIILCPLQALLDPEPGTHAVRHGREEQCRQRGREAARISTCLLSPYLTAPLNMPGKQQDVSAVVRQHVPCSALWLAKVGSWVEQPPHIIDLNIELQSPGRSILRNPEPKTACHTALLPRMAHTSLVASSSPGNY